MAYLYYRQNINSGTTCPEDLYYIRVFIHNNFTERMVHSHKKKSEITSVNVKSGGYTGDTTVGGLVNSGLNALRDANNKKIAETISERNMYLKSVIFFAEGTKLFYSFFEEQTTRARAIVERLVLDQFPEIPETFQEIPQIFVIIRFFDPEAFDQKIKDGLKEQNSDGCALVFFGILSLALLFYFIL